MEDFDMLDPTAKEGNARDGEIKNVMERFANGVNDGFKGVLFTMSKDTGGGLAFIITMIVDAFQLSALATPALFTKELKMHSSLMAIAQLTNAFELTQYVSLAENTLTIIAIALVTILLFNVLYVGYSWATDGLTKTKMWTVALLRSITNVLSGVLYIPIVTIMASSLSCTGGDSFTCQTLRPASALLLVFLVMFSLAVTATFYDAKNDGGSPARLPHSRVAVLHQAIRTLLATLAGVLPNVVTAATLPTVLHFWGGLLTGCALVLLFAYVWLQPYYSRRINSVRATLVAIYLWISVAFLVSDAYTAFSPDAMPVPTAVFAVGLACTLPMVRLLISYRRSKLLDTCRRHKVSSMFPALDTELKVRFMLEEAVKQQKMKVATMGNKQSKNTNLADIPEVMQEAAALFVEVSNILSESSQISLLHAQFLLFERDKPLLARRAMLLAEARSPAIDESFVIFKMKKHLEENAFQSNDILSFVTSEKHLALSDAYDKRCCLLLGQFWKSLGDPKMDVKRIRLLADLISDASSLADESYKKLLKLRPQDAVITEKYAGFMETIGNDPEEARKLDLRAQDLRQRNNKTAKNDADITGIDATSAILTVDASGTPLENGRVMAANTMAGLFFKQPTDFLVNKAVGTVLLPPFTNGFNEMIADYLGEADETFFNKPFDTYVKLGMGRDETLLPCRLLVKPFTSDGVHFQMYFSLTELHTATADVALVDPTTLAIVGVTKGLRGLMSSLTSSDKDVAQESISIEDAIAGYGRLASTWRGQPAFEHELTPRVLRALPGTVTLQVSQVRLHGPTSPALDRITFTRDVSRDGSQADSGSEIESVNSDVESDVDSDAGQPPRVLLRPSILSPRNGEGSKSPQSKTRGVCFQEPEDSQEPADLANIEDGDHPLARQPTRRTAGEAPAMSSGASSVGTASTAGGIRRKMLSNRHKLDKHLSRFRRLFVYTTAVSMCMIIAMYTVRSTSLAAHKADDPGQAGERRFLAVSISYFAHALVLMNQGISLPCGLTEAAARAELDSLSTNLHEISDTLYHRQKTFVPDLKYFYDKRSVAMREIGPLGTPVKNDRTIFDASMLMVGNAQKASKMELSEFTNDSPEVYLLVHNVRHHDHEEVPGAVRRLSYLEALNRTTILYTSQNSEFLPLMNFASAIVASLVVFISIIILIIILLPAVNKIDRTNIKVFHELAGMPSQVFPVVSMRFKQRLEMVHGEADQETEDFDNQDDDDHDADIDEETMMGTLKNSTKPEEDEEVDEDDEDQIARQHQSSLRSHKQASNAYALDQALKANSVRCRVMTRMSGNILVFLIYFVVTLFVSFDMEKRTSEAPSESNYGGLRQASLRLAAHELRIFATGGEAHGGWDIKQSETDKQFDHLGSIHDALIYGDQNRGLSGILHSRDTNVDQEALMFTNGCLNWEETPDRPAATIPACSEYRDGLMDAGLHRATLHIVDLGRLLSLEMSNLIEGKNASAPILNDPINPPAFAMPRRLLQEGEALPQEAALAVDHSDHSQEGNHSDHSEEGEPADDYTASEEGEPVVDHFGAEQLNSTLNSPLFTQLCEMETFYLQPMLASSVHFYKAQEHMIVEEEETVQKISLGVLIVSTLLLYVYVVRKLVNNLDIEVKRTRGLLLMIPDDILVNLSGLRKFLYKEVANQ